MKDQITTFVTSESTTLNQTAINDQVMVDMSSLFSPDSSSLENDIKVMTTLIKNPMEYIPVPTHRHSLGRYDRGQWGLVPVRGNEEAIRQLLFYWDRYCWSDWDDIDRYDSALRELKEAYDSGRMDRVYGFGRSSVWEILPTYTPRNIFETSNSLAARAVEVTCENVCPACATVIAATIGLLLWSPTKTALEISQTEASWIAEFRAKMDEILQSVQAMIFAGGDRT